LESQMGKPETVVLIAINELVEKANINCGYCCC